MLNIYNYSLLIDLDGKINADSIDDPTTRELRNT